MNIKILIYLLVVLIVFCGIFLGARMLKAQEQEKEPTEISEISYQLQQILQNQKLIISKLNDMEEELRIIKIRSTVKR